MLDYPVGPKYDDQSLYNTRAEGDVRQKTTLRGEGNVKMEVEIGLMWLQAKEGHGLSKVTEAMKEAGNGFSPKTSEKVWPC